MVLTVCASLNFYLSLRKEDNMNFNFETKFKELYNKVLEIESRMHNLERNSIFDSENTENLIAEEVHWIVKVLRKLFCYA